MLFPIIKPMEPIKIDSLVLEKNWLYQLKWDGVRVITTVEAGDCHLYTRNGNSRTHIYPEITKEIKAMFQKQSVILDGEIVALKNNRPDFFHLMRRDRLKNTGKIEQMVSVIPVYYVIFDILFYKDQWLLDQPLINRLAVLEEIKQQINTPLLEVCPTSDNGENLFNFTKDNNWEGIVLKEKQGTYHEGKKHRTWRKLKHYHELEVTIIGILLNNSGLSSMLLAKKEKGQWKYVGKAAIGLTQEERYTLKEKLKADIPFMHVPSYMEKNVLWVKPFLKATVQFLEFTPDGTLRSPIIKHFCME